ncbi:DUF418 domain-containing protein [Rothia nasimurium]|uniref:DUF418 domain-containing protein n=1 Tax=Rothia nasimurium TaxID=85336 RepID=UPI003615DD83
MKNKQTPSLSTSGRYLALDVLRGMAIIGTLATNISIFASTGITNLASALDGGGEEQVPLTSLLVNLVTDGKWIGLLTIMFGIGLEIQRQSALKKGKSWPGRYPWRAALLILDGLLNYIFIFEYDVLMGYGLTALVVCVVLATTPRTQKIWLAISLVAYVLVIGAIWANSTFFAPLEEGDAQIQQFAEGGDVQTEDIQMATSTSYWGAVIFRLENFWSGRYEIPIMFVMGIALFLAGAHLYRAGLFKAEQGALRKKIMLYSFTLGLALDWSLRLWQGGIYSGALGRYLTSTLVSFGLLAAVAHFYAGGRQLGPLGYFFTIIGRTALSCYILQNLIASIIFYDWGLGLAAKIDPTNSSLVWLSWFLISLALFAFSWLWLRFFPRGPVELIWHSSFMGINKILDQRSARKAASSASSESSPKTE